jgi:hypothetical protein
LPRRDLIGGIDEDPRWISKQLAWVHSVDELASGAIRNAGRPCQRLQGNGLAHSTLPENDEALPTVEQIVLLDPLAAVLGLLVPALPHDIAQTSPPRIPKGPVYSDEDSDRGKPRDAGPLPKSL